MWSLECSEWNCRIDEGTAGFEAVCWSPDSRHILSTAQFAVWSFILCIYIFPSWLLPYIKPSAPFNGVVAGREECGIHQVPEASQASRSQPLLGCTARFWRRRCYSRLLARRPISGSHWATQLPRLHLPVWRRTMAPHSGTHMTRTSCAFLVHTVSAIKMTDKKI